MVGQLVAKKLGGFDVHIVAYDAFPNHEMAEKYNVKFVDLDTLMKESDIVSVNCRLIPETYHMVGKDQIALMKPTAILVNTARSGLVTKARCMRPCATARSAAPLWTCSTKSPPASTTA